MATLQSSPSKTKSSDEVTESPMYTITTPSPFDRIVPSPFPIEELQSLQRRPSGQEALEPRQISISHPIEGRISGPPPGYAFSSSQDDVSLSDKSIPPGYDDRSSLASHTTSPKQTLSEFPSKQLSSGANQEASPEKKKSGPDSITRATDSLLTVDSRAGDQQTDVEHSYSTEMDFAKMIGRGRMHDQSSVFSAGKGKEKSTANDQSDGEAKNRELMDIWEKIERAHGTRLEDQSFAIQEDQVTDAKPEPSTWRDHHSDSPSFDRDPSEMITADQFIQENNSSRAVSPAIKSSSSTVGPRIERPVMVKTNSVSSKLAGMFGRKESLSS